MRTGTSKVVDASRIPSKDAAAGGEGAPLSSSGAPSGDVGAGGPLLLFTGSATAGVQPLGCLVGWMKVPSPSGRLAACLEDRCRT